MRFRLRIRRDVARRMRRLRQQLVEREQREEQFQAAWQSRRTLAKQTVINHERNPR